MQSGLLKSNYPTIPAHLNRKNVKCIDGSAIRPNSFIDLGGGIVHPSNIPNQMSAGLGYGYN